MAQGRKVSPIPMEHIHTKIPAHDKQRVELFLYSDLQRCVPYGAWQEFLTLRIREFFDWKVLSLEAYGFPPGYFVKGPAGMIEELKSKLEHLP